MNEPNERATTTPEEVRSRHQANRIAWNQGAQHYTDNLEQQLQKLKDGHSNLHGIERANLERIGPFEQWCRRAIHLQCASGYDTLSLHLEGATEVVGIDISDAHIRNARWTSDRLGMPARWFRCDVLDAPTSLDGSADLVYTGRGALCWLHDIEAWAGVVARLMRAGGVLSLLDDHPASWLFSQESATLHASGISYFGHAETNRGWSDEYIGDLGKPEAEHAIKHERLWTLADVFQALVGAGLSVEYLGEHPEEYWLSFPKLSEEAKGKLPMTFSMIARKPA